MVRATLDFYLKRGFSTSFAPPRHNNDYVFGASEMAFKRKADDLQLEADDYNKRTKTDSGSSTTDEKVRDLLQGRLLRIEANPQ